MRRMRLTGSTSVIVALLAALSLHGSPGHASAQRHHRAHLAAASRVIQCVAFARTASDVALPGNAVNFF